MATAELDAGAGQLPQRSPARSVVDIEVQTIELRDGFLVALLGSRLIVLTQK
jgi:hypothetical protein